MKLTQSLLLYIAPIPTLSLALVVASSAWARRAPEMPDVPAGAICRGGPPTTDADPGPTRSPE
jgi:hypothetical protein